MNRKARRTAAKQIRSVDMKGASTETLDLLVDKALANAQAQKWPEAEAVLRQIVTAHPTHAEALHQLGIALGRLGRAVEGIDFLRKATELKPAESLYWNNLSVCSLAAARPHDAVEAARRATAIDPHYGMAWDSLGDALTTMKDYLGARDAYERSIATKGVDLASLKRLANCQMNIGDLAAAEANLQQALQLAPDDLEVLSNLGSVLVALHKPAAALVHLEQAVERTPDQFSVAYNYARALAATDQSAKAIRWLRRATSIDHRAHGPWLHLGELLLKTGDVLEALVAAKRARDLAPGLMAATDLLQRVEFAVKPGMVKKPASPAPRATTMWDFHLGDGAPAQSAPSSGLDVTIGKDKTLTAEAGGKPVKEAESAKPADGIVDLTVLKIG
jgi:Flp pilus assembly protein TadD